MRYRSLLLLAAATGALPALAQDQDFSKVEVKAEKVAGAVYVLYGAGGNIGVSVGDDGVVLVDDQFAPLVPKIEAALRTITDRPVRFVLNTHWHSDHTGGNAALQRNAPVIAHENVRRRLAEGNPNLLGHVVPPAPKEALPIITFQQGVTVHLNGEDIKALHYAKGHTDGDSIVFFPRSNVVHMGDDFVTYGFPFVDVASGGSAMGLVDNAEKAMAAVPDDVKVIPGHGKVSTKADVLKYVVALRDSIDLVRAARKKGLTLEQAKANHVLAKYDALGQGFVKTDDFLELVYRELDGSPHPAASTKHH
jgi:glyoxylase-like metal-dependent hydrolase (beta-lactamase superfamily II)